MNVRLTSHGYELDSELEKYTNAKVAQLAKLLPRALRQTANFRVHFTQTKLKDAKFNTCSLTFELGGTELRSKETTVHMYAALDIAAVHLEHQLAAYVASEHKHRLRTRLKRSFRQG